LNKLKLSKNLKILINYKNQYKNIKWTAF